MKSPKTYFMWSVLCWLGFGFLFLIPGAFGPMSPFGLPILLCFGGGVIFTLLWVVSLFVYKKSDNNDVHKDD
jgi:hypothetical protein